MERCRRAIELVPDHGWSKHLLLDLAAQRSDADFFGELKRQVGAESEPSEREQLLAQTLALIACDGVSADGVAGQAAIYSALAQDDAARLEALATCQQYAEDWNGYCKTLTKLETTYGDEERFGLMVCRGWVFEEKLGLIDDAIELYCDLARDFPSSEYPRQALALIVERSADEGEAARRLEAILDRVQPLEQTPAHLLTWLVSEFERSPTDSSVIDEVRRCIAERGLENDRAWASRIQTLLEAKDYAGVRTGIEQRLAQTTDADERVSLLFRLADVTYLLSGELDRSEQALMSLLDLLDAPGRESEKLRAKALERLWQVQLAQGKATIALQTLGQLYALEEAPARRAWLAGEIAALAIDVGDLENVSIDEASEFLATDIDELARLPDSLAACYLSAEPR